MFLSLLEIPLRDTRFFGVARGHSRGVISIVIGVPELRKVGPIGGRHFSCRECYNVSKARPVLSLYRLSLHFVRFRKVSQYGMVSQ